ncbi:2-keto-4-pentenoate hydratase [Phaeobacter sp. 11ANDIMAR09]|uniref:2-keto-4-pentenoate hydratase n=1 Tax=Phaeobacter sp. 11ANDIMAR09 TaxID=1225647 RepID=UPI0006C88A43|nr:fumarylacetoacetate hydrolase family protein [Phaeobacter sp. 11ANDIMAR09]KPD11057.1 4-oxalocrotonate decarboxylase [Phaeobacter sp. 11ANDIMAR09]
MSLEKIAQKLDQAATTGKAIPQFSNEQEMSVEEAYAVQSLSMALRRSRGEQPVGFKMGLTSKAKMKQVGVDEVIWGHLTDAMQISDGDELALAGNVHPRAEPEIAFIMGKTLSGDVSAAQAMAAVEYICPAIEIIDSRYANFKFSLSDVIADNTSASKFVLGNRYNPDTDISNLGMVVEVDGSTRAVGSSAAILGNPVRSLIAASRMLAKWGHSLKEGDILLAGAATEALPLSPGQSFRTMVQNLGHVSFQTTS